MAEHPLLIFPNPSRSERARLRGGGGRPRIPDHARQAERLAPQFANLQSAMDGRRAELRDNPLGIQPEKTLVLETVGTTIDDFINATRRVDGLEWLGESEVEDIAPDHGFEDEANPDKALRGQLFLMMSDQQALSQMKSLFDQWHESPDAAFPYGLTKLRDAFTHLYDIRPWGPEDRIRETGLIDDWQIRLADGDSTVPFEAELWFRDGPAARRQTERHLQETIRSLGGEVVQQAVIQEIKYHAILGNIPAANVQDLIERPEARRTNWLFRSEGVMYIRPVGQCAVHIPEDDADIGTLEDEDVNGESLNIPDGEPIAALFDGMPLANHRKLSNRLVVDDPDGYEAAYQANQRRHGTAMSSLICRGDLDERGEPIRHKLYARPIMKPSPALRDDNESIPDDVLHVDLIHRAVRRLFEPENGDPPASPSVKVINLSIGDPMRPFAREMSSMARLLDWLSYKHNVLFIVSAGNHTQDIEIAWREIRNLSHSDRQSEIIKAVADDTRNRRLLSPAETVNGLTVGASHSDASQTLPPWNTIDPFGESGLPAITSAHGPGYRRAIKPDILLPGGKQLLKEKLATGFTELAVVPNNPPGHLVAAPGAQGRLNQTRYMSGTSNAAALASRSAHFAYDIIDGLREGADESLPKEYDAVLIKTLLVHGASWENVYPLYQSVLRNSDNSRTFKDYAGQFMGYGVSDVSKAMVCTDQRVTLLGVGSLSDGEADEFTFPLPPSLLSKTHKRRLAITMAWLTPVNTSHRNYRGAHLWFNPKEQNVNIAPDRMDADHRAVQRGTVQHEVLEGSRAVPFQDGDSIAIKVNCRADGGEITEPIRYGLAATLEVAEALDLPIYQEVRDRLPVRVPVSV